MTALILERLSAITTLAHGGHANLSQGACAMEAVAYIAGEPWSDHPKCACPVISAFMRSWNDSMGQEDRDRFLLPLIPRLVGSRSIKDIEHRRSLMAADWLVRVHTPAWLRLAGLSSQADALAGLPEITAMERVPSICGPLEAARKDAAAARDAARAAAWDAAGAAARAAAGAAAGAAAWDAARAAARAAAGAAAGAAAWDAAWDAAWSAARAAARAAAGAAAGAAAWDAARAAAWDAAWDAAWSAARDAAGAAAWAAAWDAAWSAAGAAAGAAAWDAARDALKPIVADLQVSGIKLIEQMLDVGTTS